MCKNSGGCHLSIVVIVLDIGFSMFQLADALLKQVWHICRWVLFRVQYVTKDGHITTIFMKKKHKGSHAIMKIKGALLQACISFPSSQLNIHSKP